MPGQIPSPSKRSKLETNFDFCIICQNPKGTSVKKPSLDSHRNILKYVKEFATYGVPEFVDISARLQNFTNSDLKDKQATWHVSCYSNTCHGTLLERARKRYDKACSNNDSDILRKKAGRPPAVIKKEANVQSKMENCKML